MLLQIRYDLRQQVIEAFATVGLLLQLRANVVGHQESVGVTGLHQCDDGIRHRARIQSRIGQGVGRAEQIIDHVLFGSTARDAAAADSLAKGAVLIVMSSIPVETTRRQAAHLAARGVGYVDAPVSGGEKGAIERTLTIMAGGDASVVERVRPLLETMGRVTRVGPTGAGQLSKLANQAIVGITIGAVAEAMTLARRGGADPVAVRAALLGGFADSAILRQHGQRMIDGAFAPGGRARLQLKDLRTARLFAAELGIELPLLQLAEQQFQHMCDRGLAELDHSALYLMLDQSDV